MSGTKCVSPPGIELGLSRDAIDPALERQQALLDAIVQDPAVQSVGAAVGAGGGLYTLNDGRVFIQLKPHGQGEPIQQVIDRLRNSHPGSQLYM